jgi:hypothetical protein
MMAPMSLNCPALNHHTKPRRSSWTGKLDTDPCFGEEKKREEESGRADIYGLRFLMR